MIPVARFSSEILAEAAAAFLRDSGIPAMVVGQMLPETATVIPGHGISTRALDVVVASESFRTAAKAALEEFHRTRPELEPGWEDATRPDLSKLDPGILVRCPSCRHEQAAREINSACQECGVPIDVAALIVNQHGPEAFSACFDADEPPQPSTPAGAVIDHDPPRHAPPGVCAFCRALLPTAGARGRCTSCGTLYDTDARDTRRPRR